ncbi:MULTISPECIES: DUF1830 domain-containing protein [Synechocystis]|uniref:DUF1830 domain-containing protein n=1 Tax=Synechocystis salina LEGE 00031 TaxID=1828736 RepID=A0ABR9VNS6_9SYNC|nr:MULTISPECIES: DUF1830 domain-containing protein [Synechocystis]MBD2652322.1 DUF1830 domain-containing protein [Synechocystis sp. FACHB-383]MBE9194850.1 DUF1830 domain-containing protein [Synechocystis sp. LEGE 06083]MBE9239856.1 DUF1830 domain-containing protein [Synechocystis salina LEGE 00041]MBE9252990.1 DUF1830 domain-containing protein [Synechocystis salina LEGE 00031]
MATINDSNNSLTPAVHTSKDGNDQLCYYRNSGNKLQQIIIDGTWKKEKLIFPGEQLLFWAQPQDQLTVKIFQSDQVLVDSITCDRLLVH